MRYVCSALLIAILSLALACERGQDTQKVEPPKATAADAAPSKEPATKEPAPLAQRPVDGAFVEVAEVTDGDTFRARFRDGSTVAIRLQGLDCPEIQRNSTCRSIEEKGGMTCDRQIELGHEATGVAKRLLAEDTRVTLESAEGQGTLPTGGFGRRLAYVRLADGRDFGLEMIRQTACKDFGYRYSHPRSSEYKRAE